MSFQKENIGIMDEAYFVSRGDILKWANDLLQLNLTKIEQFGSAAVYCQVIDVIHPNTVALNKVNWKAKNDYEFTQNYRILQDAFKKNNIKRYIQVQKLAKARYQDNLQFAQWLKRYYDLNCGDRGNNYLGQERRGGVNPDFGFAEKNVVPKTYNASGQIIPGKKQSPPKKVETVVPPVKKEKIPQVVPKKTSSNPITNLPKTSGGDRPKISTKEKIEGSPKGNYQPSQKQQYLQNCLRQLEQKLQMVTQIVRSKDQSDMKIQMIAQVLDIALDTELKQQQVHENHENYEGTQVQNDEAL